MLVTSKLMILFFRVDVDILEFVYKFNRVLDSVGVFACKWGQDSGQFLGQVICGRPMVETLGLIGTPSLCTLGSPYISGRSEYLRVSWSQRLPKNPSG